jgi:hypothetical protein
MWCPLGSDALAEWLAQQASTAAAHLRQMARAGRTIEEMEQEYPGAGRARIEAAINDNGDDR